MKDIIKTITNYSGMVVKQKPKGMDIIILRNNKPNMILKLRTNKNN